MSELPHSDDQSPANPFWLNAVQTLTACNMLAILVPCVVALFNPNDLEMYLGFLLFLTPFSAPFFWVFWKLSAWPDARTIKRALAIAASWAFVVLIPSLLLAWDTADDRYSGRTNGPSRPDSRLDQDLSLHEARSLRRSYIDASSRGGASGPHLPYDPRNPSWPRPILNQRNKANHARVPINAVAGN